MRYKMDKKDIFIESEHNSIKSFLRETTKAQREVVKELLSTKEVTIEDKKYLDNYYVHYTLYDSFKSREFYLEIIRATTKIEIILHNPKLIENNNPLNFSVFKDIMESIEIKFYDDEGNILTTLTNIVQEIDD